MMKQIRTEAALAVTAAAFLLLCTGFYCSRQEAQVVTSRASVSQRQELTGAAATASPNVPTEKVNLNTASAAELTALPGIGEVLAGRIVDYREAHGAFSSLEELDGVKGIGEGRINAIRDYVTLEDEDENTGGR